MCGRTSCALRGERYECAATYYDPTTDQHIKPVFDTSSCIQFKPSPNLAPTEASPVLVWNPQEQAVVLKPMIWGLVPSWADSSYSSSKYHTHNCRVEGLSSSPLYKPQLAAGRRAVALCEGYYEWESKGERRKTPAFIYLNQPDGMRVEETECWEEAVWTHKLGWTGPKLTAMAALYSVIDAPHKDFLMSYSVVTMNASAAVSWLHHRMPAVLSTQEQIMDWLNYEDTAGSEAVANLQPVESLSWHFVSTAVNNSRYKGLDCNKPIQEKKGTSQATLTSWFTRAPVKRESDNNENCSPLGKKFK